MSAQRSRPTADQYQAAAALRAELRRFDQASERMLRHQGLTRERYELLLAIKRAEIDRSSTTVSELTAALGVAQVSVSQLVRRVEDAGLLTREVSPIDARVRYLKLTKKGERQLARAVTDLAEERARLATALAGL